MIHRMSVFHFYVSQSSLSMCLCKGCHIIKEDFAIPMVQLYYCVICKNCNIIHAYYFSSKYIFRYCKLEENLICNKSRALIKFVFYYHLPFLATIITITRNDFLFILNCLVLLWKKTFIINSWSFSFKVFKQLIMTLSLPIFKH